MRINFMVLVLFLLALSINSFAQTSVKVTPNKVTYTRTGKDVPDHKKTFNVIYPKINGNAQTPKIEELLSYWKHFETNLEEVKSDTFYHEFNYEVNYNDRGFLNITLMSAGVAAYPSEQSKTILIELESGRLIGMKDAFTNRTGLYKKLEIAHKNEINKAIADMKTEDGDVGVDSLKYELESSKEYNSIYEIDEFSINDKGVTFHFDYGFRHATRSMEPEGRYFFSWEELKPFVGEYGTLGRFLTKSK